MHADSSSFEAALRESTERACAAFDGKRFGAALEAKLDALDAAAGDAAPPAWDLGAWLERASGAEVAEASLTRSFAAELEARLDALDAAQSADDDATQALASRTLALLKADSAAALASRATGWEAFQAEIAQQLQGSEPQPSQSVWMQAWEALKATLKPALTPTRLSFAGAMLAVMAVVFGSLMFREALAPVAEPRHEPRLAIRSAPRLAARSVQPSALPASREMLEFSDAAAALDREASEVVVKEVSMEGGMVTVMPGTEGMTLIMVTPDAAS